MHGKKIDFTTICKLLQSCLVNFNEDVVRDSMSESEHDARVLEQAGQDLLSLVKEIEAYMQQSRDGDVDK